MTDESVSRTRCRRLASYAFFLSLCQVCVSQRPFCPLLDISSTVTGLEDSAFNLHEAWKAQGKLGLLFHSGCDRTLPSSPFATCISSEACIPDPQNWTSTDPFVASFYVSFGSLTLSTGYTNCNAKIDNLQVLQSGAELQRIFSLTAAVSEINCMLRYLTFQGLPNANRDIHLAVDAAQPTIRITVTPTCKYDPNRVCLCPPPSVLGPYCGSAGDAITIVESQILLTPVNDAPQLVNCPKYFLQDDSRPGANISWRPADGGPRCAAVPLTPYGAGPAVPAGAPPAQTRLPARPDLTRMGQYPGDYVRPTQITAFSANQNLPGLCAANEASYLYDIEDMPDLRVNLVGMRIQDVDLYYGQLRLQLQIVFAAADLTTVNDNALVPRYLTSIAGQVLTYCSASATGKPCAAARADSVGGLIVLSAESLSVRVLPTAVRPPAAAGAAGVVCPYPVPTCVPTAGQCQCHSNVPSVVGGVYTAVLFYSLVLAAGGEAVETGVIELQYRNGEAAAACAFTGVAVAGTMTADSGYSVVPAGGGGAAAAGGATERADLFAAAPLAVTGCLRPDGTVVLLAETAVGVAPVYTLRAAALAGGVALPNATVPLANGSTPAAPVVRGTLEQINIALQWIQYSTPAGAAGAAFDTMTRTRARPNASAEAVVVSVDDNGSLGARPRPDYVVPRYNKTLGNATIFDFRFVVVARNHAPVLQGEDHVIVDEDQPYTLTNLNVYDPDADAVIGPEAPKGIEIMITAFALHGTLRLGTGPGPADPPVFVTAAAGKACAAACAAAPGGGAAIMGLGAAEYLALPAACRTCVEPAAAAEVARGAPSLRMYATLAAAQQILPALTYQGLQNYNWNNTDDFVPTTQGSVCPAPTALLPAAAPPCHRSLGHGVVGCSGDVITVFADDLGNTGCLDAAPRNHTVTFPVLVRPVPDTPVISLRVVGQVVCCSSGTDYGCPGGGMEKCPALRLVEDTSFIFNGSTSLQLADGDAQHGDFNAYRFRVAISVAHGVLVPPPAAAPGTAAAAVGYSRGAAGCAACADLEVAGPLCGVNDWLAGLTYIPRRHFNTDFGVSESIRVTVSQVYPPTPAALAGGAAPAVSLEVAVAVAADDDPPTVRLASAPPADVGVTFVDIFEGGPAAIGAPLGCAAGVPCFEVGDVDACEQSYRALAAAPADLDAVILGTAEPCADPGLGGNVTVVMSTEVGSLWFFSRSDWADSDWPPGPTAQPPDTAGRHSRTLTLTAPLPWFKGGLLRYYPALEYTLPDSVAIRVVDLGNTGSPDGGGGGGGGDGLGSCCCDRAAGLGCPACVTDRPCGWAFNVSACLKVNDGVCWTVGKPARGVPSWGSTLIIIMSLSAGLGGITKLSELGHSSVARAREAAAEKARLGASEIVYAVPTA